MLSTTAKPKIIIICGPTALGKTATAIDLAENFNAEIVGADSMQVYRHMDIGTAKPTPNEQARIPHHMIDIVDPDEHFDAKIYSRMAGDKIGELFRQGMVPFIVGGTGFYIKALVRGLFEVQSVAPDVRRRLQQEAKAYGADHLHRRLRRVDPEAAANLHPNDSYRIIRALEIYTVTGEKISEHHRSHKFSQNPFDTLKIGLKIDREKLYVRINRRVDTMIEAGFVEEVRNLLKSGYTQELKSMQSIGYRHMVDYLTGRQSWDRTVDTLKRDTRRYAKRQLTWFKADPSILWYDPGQIDNICRTIQGFFKRRTSTTPSDQ